jgi:hypothetical protein
MPLLNGSFIERWAYLVEEIAGQAAIDVLLGPSREPSVFDRARVLTAG